MLCSEALPACQIKQGESFRKLTGSYVYRRISESSVKFLKLDPYPVYGVCHNGNVAVVEPGTLVYLISNEEIFDAA